jgi:FtsP/CotA-like multicopper oxidase with cupredoxin domain
VEILNHLNEETAIHWHGIELESYNDGVANFGGSSGSITPPVAPHGTFTASFTPPRAGTFIYHTHWHNAGQLSGGIYGPLVVLEPGERFDPESDHIVIMGLEGRYRTIPSEPFAVNGRPGTPARTEGRHSSPAGVNITVGVGLTGCCRSMTRFAGRCWPGWRSDSFVSRHVGLQQIVRDLRFRCSNRRA